MKFVSLVVTVMMISFGSVAQNTGHVAEKRTVTKVQKIKKQKAKASALKISTIDSTDVTTLKDEKAYKAKWTFEQMLQRRVEIDAEEGERKQQKE